MRYRPIVENPLEEQLFQLPEAPFALCDTFFPLLQARAIMAGVDLGIFEGLRAGAETPERLGEALGLDADTLDLLLRVLACAGYVARERGGYVLTENARQTLLADSPLRLTAYVGLNAFSWEWISRLEDVLRTGRGFDMHHHLGNAARWSTYQSAMLEVARRAAPLVAALVPIKAGARKMLDIAGSHGLYGALICRTHPPLRSEVLDLPEAVDQSRELARAEGIADVVTHRVGNALTDDLGRDYDVVFLGNIIHHFTPAQSLDLLRRARRAMAPEGTLAIWEVRRPEPDAPPSLVGDGFALYFRLTSTARCYSEHEYTGWLAEAGFNDVRVHPTPLMPAQILVTGRA